MATELEQAIYQTVRYFDIFDLSVTATQIWQCLILEQEQTSGPRWGGRRHWTLSEVQAAVTVSSWLAEKLGREWGYVFLAGRDDLVPQRLRRHRLSQAKWKIAARAAKFLAVAPLVRGLAGSGSLALDNTKEDSDLDFLIITAPRRIWTTRLLLLIISQLLGRRRKHWYKRAPDMLCLNHYVSQQHLHLPSPVHNVYNAVQYALLVPVYNPPVVAAFARANASWTLQHVMLAAMPDIAHQYTLTLPPLVERIKKVLESLLLEPIGDLLERFAERLQRAVIRRHQAKAGRVALSENELAFHPDTKVPSLLVKFYQDPGQARLL